METLYITSPACHRHEMGSWHPECPERLDAVNDQLLSSGVLPLLDSFPSPRPATEAEVLRVHAESHLAHLKALSPASGYAAIDGDTLMNPHTLAAAFEAAGAGIAAVDSIMRGEANSAFCNVRPPGHHAESARAMGFCFFNNVAVAAAHALEHHGLERVAIVDFDVHHGNGTEDIFFDDPRVMMCSFYQHPFYPNLRREGSRDHMVNIPVDAYTTGFDLRQVVSDIWVPRLYHFAPQMLFISAGFDAHREDEMGQLGMVEGDYAWITDQLVALAERTAQGRIVSMLEGGYNLSALGRSAVAHIRSLSKL
ncbi:histone deacetylase family protein [Yanghanlia caeni]|uniref:Histone deacetylase family protein n=1 Tax=Yanghanlia caeni TaxID=3064283 RepID=A0ABU1D353_9BURK|nr:histone deacetylase family protein [Alcaligenaceae bacterium LG-2]NGR09442.1 histone deacetylase family protein [bacterium SGD-2]